MNVVKRQVEEFEIQWPDTAYDTVTLSREQAVELHAHLTTTLGFPPVLYEGCGDRLSHDPHWWGKDENKRCTGRRFDAT